MECLFGVFNVILLFNSVYGLFFRGYREEIKVNGGNDDFLYRSLIILEKFIRI